ncbi:putative lipase/esterase [Aspergillus alliaceus]|uniref:putative lipase/esterase n=1 Tax=Petromyces alliaceus TaxID=209559 RepID=UPI0012A679AE|nr:Alpha/Beta hydrolase protein [Aspergillus alliaceus]KAB8229015.1 Alpha/Beta hydrolase protein [Aspergillus alliaceus]
MTKPSLNPEWRAFLARNHTVSHDDDQRNAAFFSSTDGSLLAAHVSSVDTRVPARDDHQIPIRIYAPKEDQSSDRIVIFYHSGGFVEGNVDTEDISCRYMVMGSRSTVISVNYRLSPTYAYPVPMNDAWDAFEYVVRNLSIIVPKHIPPVRLVIAGTSSGGQLAAIVSQRARDWLQDPRTATVAANIILSGVLLRAPVTVRSTDRAFIPPAFRELHGSWAEKLETNLDRLGMAENHDLLGVPIAKRIQPDAYPLWGRFGGLPKTYIQICEVDILRDDAVCYAQGLRSAGVEVRLSMYESLPHIFWVYAPQLEVSRRAQEDCVNGLEWLLSSVE